MRAHTIIFKISKFLEGRLKKGFSCIPKRCKKKLAFHMFGYVFIYSPNIGEDSDFDERSFQLDCRNEPRFRRGKRLPKVTFMLRSPELNMETKKFPSSVPLLVPFSGSRQPLNFGRVRCDKNRCSLQKWWV